MPPRFSKLPQELSSRALLALGEPQEPTVLVLMHGIDNQHLYRVQGRTNRVLRFEWDRTRQCHALRAPLSVWEADDLALARETLDQRLLYPLIVTVELPAPEAAPLETPPTPSPTKRRGRAAGAASVKG